MSGLVDIVEVTNGTQFGCARSGSGVIWCWGENYTGQLGDGTSIDAPIPVEVALPAAVSVSAGARSTCAVDETGQAWCWGENNYGNLGDGTTTDSPTPVAVVDMDDALSISVGDDHACALREGGVGGAAGGMAATASWGTGR